MVDTDDIAKLCANHGPVSEDAHFEAGTVFGDWRLTGFIGRGGNGETYCAEHVKLGTPAAVKVLIREGERAKTRFSREAELLAKLRSDAFPRFFSYGEDNGRPYLAMELLEPGELPKGVTIAAAALVDKKGRTWLLKVGTGGMTIGLAAIGSVFLAIERFGVEANNFTGLLTMFAFFFMQVFYALTRF